MMSASGSATIDFGAFPGSNEASAVVTGQTGIGAASKTDAWIVHATSANHTESDHDYAATFVGLSTGNIVVGTGFTIYARSLERMEGQFTVQWAWA